jgi:hypothetical protein
MRRLALPRTVAAAAVAVFGIVCSYGAQAACDQTVTTMQCVWTFHGHYVVTGFNSTHPSLSDKSQFLGQSCVQVAADLLDQYELFLSLPPTSNALGDTYVLESCEVQA